VPRFDAVPPGAGPRIRGFSGDRFLVDERAYDAVLLTPAGIEPWDAPAIGDLTNLFAFP
jgi:hypothetical protein